MFLGSFNGCKHSLHMGVNTVCTLEMEEKHDLLTIFSSRGLQQNAIQPLTSRTGSCLQRFLTDFSDVIKIK